MANLKISELPINASLTGQELMPIVQSGVTRQASLSTISAAVLGQTIRINQESDFPVQDATTITLEPDKAYWITSPVTTAKRFICNGATLYSNQTGLSPMLVYTGSDYMFTVDKTRFSLNTLRFSCPNGKIVNIISDNSRNINHRVNFTNWICDSCLSVGDSTLGGSVVIKECQVSNITGTYTFGFDGDSTIVSFNRCAFLGLQAGSLGLDFGTSTSAVPEYIDIIWGGDSTAIPMSGLPNSGNVIPGGVAEVSGCNFSGFNTPLQGITEKDIRYNFADSNDGNVQTSISDYLVTLEDNNLETPITASSTDGTNAVKVLGVWSTEDLSHFSLDPSGTLTFNKESPVRIPIDITASAIMPSGGDSEVALYLTINGSVVSRTGVAFTTNSSKASSTSIHWQHTFNPGDTIELCAENQSNIRNIIVKKAIHRGN